MQSFLALLFNVLHKTEAVLRVGKKLHGKFTHILYSIEEPSTMGIIFFEKANESF